MICITVVMVRCCRHRSTLCINTHRHSAVIKWQYRSLASSGKKQQQEAVAKQRQEAAARSSGKKQRQEAAARSSTRSSSGGCASLQRDRASGDNDGDCGGQ